MYRCYSHQTVILYFGLYTAVVLFLPSQSSGKFGIFLVPLVVFWLMWSVSICGYADSPMGVNPALCK